MKVSYIHVSKNFLLNHKKSKNKQPFKNQFFTIFLAYVRVLYIKNMTIYQEGRKDRKEISTANFYRHFLSTCLFKHLLQSLFGRAPLQNTSMNTNLGHFMNYIVDFLLLDHFHLLSTNLESSFYVTFCLFVFPERLFNLAI